MERLDETASSREIWLSCNVRRLIFYQMPKLSSRVHGSPSDTFYLSHYNSSDEWPRLNHFKTNRHPIKWRSTASIKYTNQTLLVAPRYLHIKIKKHIPTWQKFKQTVGYIKSVYLIGLAYILKRMLNPLITHIHMHTHTHEHTCARACRHIRSHVAYTHITMWRRPTTSARSIKMNFLF